MGPSAPEVDLAGIGSPTRHRSSPFENRERRATRRRWKKRKGGAPSAVANSTSIRAGSPGGCHQTRGALAAERQHPATLKKMGNIACFPELHPTQCSDSNRQLANVDK